MQQSKIFRHNFINLCYYFLFSFKLSNSETSIALPILIFSGVGSRVLFVLVDQFIFIVKFPTGELKKTGCIITFSGRVGQRLPLHQESYCQRGDAFFPLELDSDIKQSQLSPRTGCISDSQG